MKKTKFNIKTDMLYLKLTCNEPFTLTAISHDEHEKLSLNEKLNIVGYMPKGINAILLGGDNIAIQVQNEMLIKNSVKVGFVVDSETDLDFFPETKINIRNHEQN